MVLKVAAFSISVEFVYLSTRLRFNSQLVAEWKY